MSSMVGGRGEIIIGCLLSRFGRRWATGDRTRSPVMGRKRSVAGLPFGHPTGTAGRGQKPLSAMVLMVWMTNLCLWLLMRKIKNLHQELIILLQALLKNVKNLNANKRFLTPDDDNCQKSPI